MAFLMPFPLDYCILSSIMCIQVKCAPEFHNDFWQRMYFYFLRIILQELIIAIFSSFTILNLCQLPSMYGAQGMFQHHFQCKKVRTILNKIRLTHLFNTASSHTFVYKCCVLCLDKSVLNWT